MGHRLCEERDQENKKKRFSNNTLNMADKII